jgi:hypothetical protein
MDKRRDISTTLSPCLSTATLMDSLPWAQIPRVGSDDDESVVLSPANILVNARSKLFRSEVRRPDIFMEQRI